MKCFFHSADLDGHCSAAIVKYFNPECELFGINYGDEFPWDSIKQNETVFMVDFSMQPFGDMVKLWGLCNLIWIDHHISAINESKSKEYQMDSAINGMRVDGIGACSLVWDYCSSTTHRVCANGNNLKEPVAVRLLAEYDVWNHSDPNTLKFQYGMRMEKTYPIDMTFWSHIFDGDIRHIIKNGETILNYEKEQNRKYISSCSFETELDGLKCIAINKGMTNSKIFDSVWDNQKYDAMLTFCFRKGKWMVSLYTDKEEVDVSEIAKTHGGGGHKQAAGFQCDYLPTFIR